MEIKQALLLQHKPYAVGLGLSGDYAGDPLLHKTIAEAVSYARASGNVAQVLICADETLMKKREDFEDLVKKMVAALEQPREETLDLRVEIYIKGTIKLTVTAQNKTRPTVG